MKVNVSQKDIDKGVRGSEKSCPIALATQRAFNTHNVDVHYNDSGDEDDNNFIKLRIKVDDEYYSHYHIDEAEHCDNFIHWFDNNETDDCKPFEFKIDTSRTTI